MSLLLPCRCPGRSYEVNTRAGAEHICPRCHPKEDAERLASWLRDRAGEVLSGASQPAVAAFGDVTMATEGRRVPHRPRFRSGAHAPLEFC